METPEWKKQSRLSKKKVTLWLEEATYWEIKRDAKLKRISQQMIMEAILVDRFSPDSMADRDALLIRRINIFDKRLKSVERLQEVAIEAIGLFVRVYYLHQSEIPQNQLDDAIARATPRYEKYLKSLASSINKQSGLLNHLSKECVLGREDFNPKQNAEKSEERQNLNAEQK